LTWQITIRLGLSPSDNEQARGILQSAEEDLRAAVATSVEDIHVLVVMDNCEHVLLAAGQLAALVLSASVDAHILATSRAPLHVEGETTFQPAPLGVPDSDQADPSGLHAKPAAGHTATLGCDRHD
jgi:predicted ATPase